MKFKIGDRVICIGGETGKFVNKTGTIIDAPKGEWTSDPINRVWVKYDHEERPVEPVKELLRHLTKLGIALK